MGPDSTNDRSWRTYLLGFIIIIAVAAAAVLLVSYHPGSSQQHCTKDSTTSCQTNSGTVKAPQVSTTEPKSTQKSKKDTAVASKTPTTATTPSSSKAPTLTNTGPGNVIGLFVGSAMVAGVGHYAYTKYKFARLR